MPTKISGKVIKGDGFGRKLGFPTANLELENGTLREEGVFCGEVELEGNVYKAAIVAGPHKKIEAHIIGFSGDAYGKKINLVVNKFLRKYQVFEGEEELISQIKKDVTICKNQ